MKDAVAAHIRPSTTAPSDGKTNEPTPWLLKANGHLWIAGLVVTLLFLCFWFSRTITDPWVEEDTWYGSVYAQAAHNNLRAGLGTTWGMPAAFYFGPLPCPSDAFYVHHPTLMPVLITASFGIFGEHEWAARLVPISFTLASVVLIWLLVQPIAGNRAATLASMLFALLPMNLHYGDMVDFEPCLLPFLLAMVLALRLWLLNGNKRWAVLLCATAFCGMAIDWPAYLLTALIVAYLGISAFRKKGRRESIWLAASLITLASLSALIFILQIRHVDPNGLNELWTAIRMRISNGQTIGSSAPDKMSNIHFTWLQWAKTVLKGLREDYLVLPWILAFCGAAWAAISIRKTTGALVNLLPCILITLTSAIYMTVLRNWSFIHDWASFYFTAPVAILGALALQSVCWWFETRTKPPISSMLCVAVIATFIGWIGWHSPRQSESMRSLLPVLDGQRPEPRFLAVDLGRELKKQFPEETTIIANFDQYGSSLAYYSGRTILGGTFYKESWDAVTADNQHLGAIIWKDGLGSTELLSRLNQSELHPLQVDGIPFTVWIPDGSK